MIARLIYDTSGLQGLNILIFFNAKYNIELKVGDLKSSCVMIYIKIKLLIQYFNISKDKYITILKQELFAWKKFDKKLYNKYE